MRKRAKVTLPKLIKEILLKDLNYFGLKMETLCNLILKEMGYDKTLRVHDIISSEKKVMVSFNLNERNTRFFKDMLDESEEDVETEYFRRLLSTYTNFHPSIRERIIKRSLFIELEYAIKKGLEAKLAIQKEVYDVYPLEIVRDQETGYNLLRIKQGNEISLYKIREVELLKIK